MSRQTLNEFNLARLEDGRHLIPDHMFEGIQRYVMRGIPGGSFLTAILCNDFMKAVGQADAENQRALVGWAHFLYNNVPSGCYGSAEKVATWIAEGGIGE